MINIFNDNKYTKWYYAIIDNAKSKNRIKLNRNSQKYIYYENHHIIPRSISPELIEDISNVVLLTAREHFICHCLLLKMTTGQHKYKMFCAFRLMCSTRQEDRYVNSRLYELLRKDMSLSDEHKKKIGISSMGKTHSQETRNKIANSLRGIKKTEEHKKKMSERIISDETRLKLSKSLRGKPSHKKGLPGRKWSEEEKNKKSNKTMGNLNHFFGKTHSEESKKKMKESRKNNPMPTITCIYCGKQHKKSMHVRWHGDNCKLATI